MRSAYGISNVTRSVWFLATTLFLVLVFVLGWTASAKAFPLTTSCPSSLNHSLTYAFSDGGDTSWTSNQKTWFHQGGVKWEGVADPFGGSFVSFFESGSNPDYTVVIEDLGAGFGGVVRCSSNEIVLDLIDEQEDLTAAKVKGLAAHEVGHAFDLAHAGDAASFGTMSGSLPTEAPTMATCSVDFALKKDLAQDDHANMEWDYTGKVNMHANSSFELNSVYGWRVQAGGQLAPSSAGPSDGSYSAVLSGSFGGAVVNTSRITDPGNMDVKVNFRRIDPASSGTITYKLLARQVSYPDLSSAECGWDQMRNNWNLNEPTVSVTSYVTYAALTKTPTGSWQWPDTSNWNPPSGWRGADVRVKIVNFMQIGTDPAAVAIDHARARDL